jgi:Fe-S-cluster containining protein
MDGTFSHCSQCKVAKCCCDFGEGIDYIMLTASEKQKILEAVGTNFEKYFSKLDDRVYHLVSESPVCPFYDHGCTIYNLRPADCRLFPYDIKNIDNEYWLIKYDLACGSDNVQEIPEDAITTLMQIKDVYTASENEEKVSQLNFKIIKKIIS